MHKALGKRNRRLVVGQKTLLLSYGQKMTRNYQAHPMGMEGKGQKETVVGGKSHLQFLGGHHLRTRKGRVEGSD